jgi:hypothetical protein
MGRDGLFSELLRLDTGDRDRRLSGRSGPWRWLDRHGVLGARGRSQPPDRIGLAAAYRSVVAGMMRFSPATAQYAVGRQFPQIFSSQVGCQVIQPYDGLVDLAAPRLE